MSKYKHRYTEVYRGIRIDVRAHTSAELVEKVNKKKASIDHQTLDDSVRLSVFGRQFLEATKLHTVSASWYRDLGYLLDGIIRGVGDVPISRIRPLHLQQYINGLSGMADGTIKKHYDLLCQLFRYAYRNGITPTDYSDGLTRPRGRSAENGRALTDRERSVLLDVLDGHRGELFCKIMLYCGLRPSEVQALQWSDFDFGQNTVTVSRALKVDGSIGPPKSSAGYRTIPVPDHLLPLLLSSRGSAFDPLFSHNPTWRRRMWENVQREMNLAMGCRTYRNKLVPPYPLADDFVMYNLRHTYCTDLEKAGVPINIASRLMGHSNISITSKIYTHASTEALEIARDLINKKSAGVADGVANNA